MDPGFIENAMNDIYLNKNEYSYGDVEKYERSLDDFIPRNVLDNIFNYIPLKFFEQDRNLLNNIIRLLPLEDANMLIIEIENYDTRPKKYHNKIIQKILNKSKIEFYDL